MTRRAVVGRGLSRAAALLAVPVVLAAAWAAPAAGAEPTLIARDRHGGTDGALSPDGRRLVASSQRGGSWSLWLFDRASDHWSRLTDDAGDDKEPHWSPDGTRIAFASDRSGERDIWIVTVATGALERITGTATAAEEYPAFSPDGRRVVFTGGPWKDRNFFTVDAAGGEPRPVLAETGHVGACGFGATADVLVCHTYDRGFGDLIEIALPSGETRRLTTGEGWHYKPSVSADGALVAYTEIGETGDRVRVGRLTPDGLHPEDFDAAGRWPAFAEDGRSVFFHRVVNAGNEVRLVDTQTGRAETLVGAERRPGRAALSPDGGTVAYCATAGGRSEVRLVDRASGRDRALDLPGEACFPTWSPDGRHLAITYRPAARWEVATVDPDGGGLRVWTAATPGLRDLNAPLAWAPDGRAIGFTTTTAPYESDVVLLDLANGRVRNLTHDAWYDEGPQWTPEGDGVVFMSTRGGDWTWGLFERALGDGTVTSLVAPDYVEKRYPTFDRQGRLYWIETNVCLGSTFVVRREANGDQHTFEQEPAAGWVEVSADGRYLLITRVNRRTEYWLAPLR